MTAVIVIISILLFIVPLWLGSVHTLLGFHIYKLVFRCVKYYNKTRIINLKV